MKNKILIATFVVVASFTSLAQASDAESQQAKKDFENHLIKPCEGKKSGDQVQVTTPRGMTVAATCKMTAVINIK